eukprot:4457722-Pleurochrysis_carterae.AAC.2
MAECAPSTAEAAARNTKRPSAALSHCSARALDCPEFPASTAHPPLVPPPPPLFHVLTAAPSRPTNALFDLVPNRRKAFARGHPEAAKPPQPFAPSARRLRARLLWRKRRDGRDAHRRRRPEPHRERRALHRLRRRRVGAQAEWHDRVRAPRPAARRTRRGCDACTCEVAACAHARA